MSILVIIDDNIDFSRNLFLILVKKFENLDFGQNLRKISILVNIHENLDNGQSWR